MLGSTPGSSQQTYCEFVEMLGLNDNEFFRPGAAGPLAGALPAAHGQADLLGSNPTESLSVPGVEVEAAAPRESEPAADEGAPNEPELVEETLARGDEADFFGPIPPRWVWHGFWRETYTHLHSRDQPRPHCSVDNFFEDAGDMELLKQFAADFTRDSAAEEGESSSMLASIAAAVLTATGEGSASLESTETTSGSDFIIPPPRRRHDQVGQGQSEYEGPRHQIPGETDYDAAEAAHELGPLSSAAAAIKTRTLDCVAVSAIRDRPTPTTLEAASAIEGSGEAIDGADTSADTEVTVTKVEAFTLDEEGSSDEEFFDQPRFEFVPKLPRQHCGVK